MKSSRILVPGTEKVTAVTKLFGAALVLALVCLTPSLALAQTTGFTYQGRLTDGGAPANGNYDLQFVLWDSDNGGTQVGLTQTLNAVSVSAGIFTVTLDFGANAFPGGNRFLEISARPTGAGSLTLLTPREQITSTPYAVRSLNSASADTATNATQLGGVPANQYAQTNDSRLTDARAPTAGSSNYIQNTSSPQANSNFSISGSGEAAGALSANIVNATTQYNINGNPVLRTSGTGGYTYSNTFTGVGAGNSTTPIANTGVQNSFFGRIAGYFNTTGSGNAFFGYNAGGSNTTADDNSFFGTAAGRLNTTGQHNTFMGYLSGLHNDTANDNTFIGYNAGLSNITANSNTMVGANAGANNSTGFGNSFFGDHSGYGNTEGVGNSFFGINAGAANLTSCCNAYFGNLTGQNSTGPGNAFFGNQTGQSNIGGGNNSFFGNVAGNTNTDGNNNTIIGGFADVGSNALTSATAIGFRAQVTQSNSLVLGGINGVNQATADTNVGIGTTAPAARLDVKPTSAHVLIGDPGCGPSFAGIGFAGSFSNCGNYSLIGDGTNTYINRPAGGAIFFRQNNGTEVSISAAGTLSVVNAISVGTLGSAGNTPLCRNAVNQISQCSSSLRYKKDLQPFTRGLALLNSLKPITFKWKSDNTPDLGFGAEDVAAVEPLLVTHNDKGQIEGVKYDRITAVLVNAVKEQQQQIQQQQAQITQQQNQIAGLKQVVCRSHPRAAVCK